jgi:malonyl-CoA O-methyltransferase
LRRINARCAVRSTKAATTYDQAAVLQREVCVRALERLDLVKLDPAAIIDAGCGTGFASPALHKRYPRAKLVALDIAPAMLRKARSRIPVWKKWIGSNRDVFVCGDNERLPLRSACADMLWSNLAFQWVNDLPAVFAESQRVLRPGGLLMFTTFGPDTLKECARHAPPTARSMSIASSICTISAT